MNRAPLLTGATLVAVGLVVFVWKIGVLGLPIAPTDPEGLWQVELRMTVRGSGARGSVRAPLPSSAPGQVVFDEHSASDQLLFSIRRDERRRIGVWTGLLRGTHEIVYGFRVQLAGRKTPLPSGVVEPAPKEVVSRYGAASADFPAADPEIATRLTTLGLPLRDDPVATLRVAYAFVRDEIATVGGGSDDPLLTLGAREGSPEGKTRLLITLLRAAGLPARVVEGLWLRGDGPAPEILWAEAWLDGSWIPISATHDFFASRPADVVALQTGSFAPIETTGAEAIRHRYYALREHLRPDELATMMLPPNPVLRRLSLYRLPVPTQNLLRALLLLPLGALVVALFRNVVGVPTFGTFMPVLVAFALGSVSLAPGLAMVGAVIAIGILGRLVLDRLHLLLVPRLSILLCIVVLSVTVLALVGRGLENRQFFVGVLFPIVILTMLIERFSIVMAEEGMREALVRAAYTTGVAVAAYPIFRSELAEHLMFGFPELVVAVMGLLVVIGGYTGYRLLDLVRFRAFARTGTEAP